MRTNTLRASLLASTVAATLLGSAAMSIAAQEVEGPKVILSSVPFAVQVTGMSGIPPTGALVELRDNAGRRLASGVVLPGEATELSGISVDSRSQLPLSVQIGEGPEIELSRPFAPAWFSLLPPLLAIVLALIFREVITALLAGIWLGALAVAGYNPLSATWRLVDDYVVHAVGDTGGRTQIIVFSLMLGGMVGLISKNGGTVGAARRVARIAWNRVRGKLATSIAGLVIFFDDYANTLVVGNTMRPITDRLRISREKLAYLIDSTAAPVAAIVPISTWVGYQVSLIGDGISVAAGETLGGAGAEAAFLGGLSPYAVFVQTIPYLFYPLLAIAFVVLTSVMNRDFGPMARAEARAAAGGGLLAEGTTPVVDTGKSFATAKDGVPLHWWNAAVPVLTVVLVVLGGLYTSGRGAVGADASLRDIFGAADPFSTLLWGSLAGCVVAVILSTTQRILSVRECVEAWIGGMKAMMVAMIILALAWSLGAVVRDVGTAAYLTQLLDGNLPLALLPALVFVTSGAMAFATGTSWTTMAIMLPLVIPLAVSLAGGSGFVDGSQYGILLATTSSVLAGAIWGDHCSPISDTTVLSSTAAACDHIEHVRTQLPYALLVGAVGLLLGSVGTSLGLPNWVALLGGVGVLFLFLRLFGKPVAEIAEREVG